MHDPSACDGDGTTSPNIYGYEHRGRACRVLSSTRQQVDDHNMSVLMVWLGGSVAPYGVDDLRIDIKLRYIARRVIELSEQANE